MAVTPEKIFVIIVFKNFRSYIGLDVDATFSTVKSQIVQRINNFRSHPLVNLEKELTESTIQIGDFKDHDIVGDLLKHSIRIEHLHVVELNEDGTPIPTEEHVVAESIDIPQELIDRFKKKNRDELLETIRNKIKNQC